MRHRLISHVTLTRQRGAAAVEFAIVAGIGGLFILLIGVMELGRVLFYLNTASEVTRLGARVAVVCSPGDATNSKVLTKMREMLPVLKAENIDIRYMPEYCDASSCRYVSVSIKSDVLINTFIPFVPISINLPAFQTTLPRELLDSSGNAICG